MLYKKFSNCQLFNKPQNLFAKYGTKAKKNEKKRNVENLPEK